MSSLIICCYLKSSNVYDSLVLNLEHSLDHSEGWWKHRSQGFWLSRCGVGSRMFLCHQPQMMLLWLIGDPSELLLETHVPGCQVILALSLRVSSFLLFLESAQCMGCGLIPSPHSSISVFNNNPRKQKCILLWKMLSPSNKCHMPQHLNHGLIFPFMKNSIKLLDVLVAAWRGGCSDIQKIIEHASSGLSNAFRINGEISGEMYFIQNVDGTWNVNKY